MCCMINFIICDDKKEFIDEIVNTIDKVMMNNSEAYRKHIFNEYDDNFIKMIDSNLSWKIYILDIEVKDKSGIEMARKIREKDIESMLIFVTAYYNKYMEEILKSKFMFLDFINKQNNYQKDLISTIEYALNNIKKRNIIRFKSNGIIYTLGTNDIIYICRDKDRKCTIKTTSNEFTVSKTLLELYELLDDNFVYSHRACIVNQDRIKIYNKKEHIIVFDTEDVIDLVSNRFQMKCK